MCVCVRDGEREREREREREKAMYCAIHSVHLSQSNAKSVTAILLGFCVNKRDRKEGILH